VIFAELEYQKRYEDFHDELKAFLLTQFQNVESGIQGDSYFWIFNGDEKVAIDTFTSMKHQVKSERNGTLVQKVIDRLQHKFKLNVYETPELEGHESA
jgi:hypothetical protein